MRQDLKLAAEADIDRKLKEIGVAFQGGCTEHNGEHLMFLHTIGLHEQGLPELVVFNLQLDIAGPLLGCLQAKFKALPRGTALTGKQFLEDWPFPSYLLDATEVATPFLWAARDRAIRARATATPMRILQATVCDKHGLFPWEAGCAQSIVEMHPILGALPQ